MRIAFFTVLGLLLLVFPGCNRERDAAKRAAKERFVHGTVQKPIERGVEIDMSRLRRDPLEMEKAHLLNATAAATRLGSFRLKGSTELDAIRGKRRLKLVENLSWDQAKDGAFYTKVHNSRGHGLETWWTGSKLYLRTRTGKAHERPVEAKEYLGFREDAWGAWSAAYRLFKGRLQFTEVAASRVGGRGALRFEIALAGAPLTRIGETIGAAPEKIDIGDLKVATATRRAWRRNARPVTASGTVDIDAETGVPLAISFRGRLGIPDPDEKVELAVSVNVRMDGIGSRVQVSPPPDATPEPVMRKVESKRFDLIDMVRIEDFLIDKWEYPNEKGAMPRTGVSWREARELCRRVGKRLCTAKEWQKACNSDRRRNRYPYGLFYKPDRCNTETDGPRPAGERRECRGEFEVFDLAGNVAEWVESKGKDDRKELCLAGGSFADKGEARCTRCIPRDRVRDPGVHMGLRCCR